MTANRFNTISGQPVKTIGLGTMPISDFYPPFPPESQAIQLINQAIEIGVNLIDTAMVYGDGYAEKVIGKAVNKHRQDVFIVSKCGLYRDQGNYVLDGSPESLIQHCHDSLARLNTDTLDALLIHRLDPNIPLSSSLDALNELKQQGLVRYIGLSEVDGPTIQQAINHTHIDIVQNEYSFMSREPETDGTFAMCQKHGIHFMAYSPVGRGFFTKATQTHNFTELDQADIRTILPRYQAENLAQNKALLTQLQDITQQYQCTLPQLALAWVLMQAKHFDIAIYPIPGTKRIEHIIENMKAIDITLNPTDMEMINTIFTASAFKGERWPTSVVD